MRKNIFYLTTLAIIMLFGACSNEPLFDETGKGFLPGAERLISLTATMPNDGPTTRVALEQKEDLSVALTWEEGDQLQLVFVQGDIKVKKEVTVGEISSDGKNASFEIIIPAEITDNFDLYGVYGGGGLSDEDPTIAILPAKAGETGTLESIEEQEHVMFYFASKDMKVAYSEPTVHFKNFGSLFSITLRNSGSASLDNLAEARLVGVGGDGKWAYNIGEGGGTYDLITGEFQNTEEADNYISFKAEKASLPEGESMTFWGWYPPLPGKVWPALELHLLDAEGGSIAVSANTMEERTEATAPGMSYYFNAEWDGSALGFGMTKGPHIFVKVDGEATNDGSSWAQATTLTTALELMEEGDEIHIAAGTYVPTKMLTGGDKEGDTTFEINKNVTLIGGYPADASDGAVASKANETILSGDKKFYHTVTVTAPVEDGEKVTLKNLTIKNGVAGPVDEGNVEVNGVKFNRSFAGGLSVGISVIDVLDCVISDNESKQHVGGVYVHNGALAKFTNTDIINNKATVSDVTNCGGILNAATTYLIGCNVLDNASGGVCGGIYNFDKENGGAIGPKLYIYNTTVAGNKAGASWSGGGGLYAREGSHTEIVNSTFYNNEAAHGGAIRVYTASGLNPSSANIISSTFYKNNGRSNGGGIETQPGTTVKMYNTIITGNTSPNGKDVLLAENTTTSSYLILGDKVFDKDGTEVAGKVFDHTTMISELAENGTCMITGSSPAATMGMDATLLQTLASTFTPAIDADIITKDQLGVSRSDKAAMGAVVSDGSGPAEPTLPIADMLDVVFNEDGTAKDISPMNHVMKLMLDENAPITVTKNDTYNLNIANFNPVANGQNPPSGEGSCYYFEYGDNQEFKNKLADGHTFECLVKFDVDYATDKAYETKFFSTHQSGGTGFLITNATQATGANGLTFLPNVPATDGGGSNWIWTNSQVRPDGQSWYHLVGVWDKDAGKSYIYVNGEKKAEVDAAGFYRAASLTPLWATIGADPGVYPAIQNPFKGSLAIARIYDKPLTEAEAMLLWNEVIADDEVPVAEPNIYVKTTGNEANDGSSWAKATTLTKALELMKEGDEIHIAAGTYVPTKMLTGGDKEGDTTFEINKNVTLIGGYPADASDGAVASKANETILSGDNKFYHTVTITAPVETDGKVTLKNLAIKNGLAAEKGAAAISINGHDYLRDYGGGLSIGGSVVEFIDCLVADNVSRYHAGGIYVHNDANVKFIDSDIINNKTINPSSNCGGLWNAATTTLIGCNILDNYTTGVSGGIYNYEGNKNPVQLYIYNSTIARNKTGGAGGGGVYARESSYTQIVNSTFYQNESGTGGGFALYATAGKESLADVINSTFYSNKSSGNGGGINTVANTTLNLHNSIVTGNTSATGDFNFVGNSTKSYVILGDKVFDKDGIEVAGKVFDHTTMISELAENGTCMITASSPAATMGMNATLLQTLAATFTPAIDNTIITNDQLNKSRSGKSVMGAVVPDVIEEPTEPETGVGIKKGSEQVLWAKKMKEDLGIDTLQVTGGMAVTKDYVVLNTRGLESIYLNRMTGEKLGTLNMGSIVVPGGLSNFYNTADDDGNILVCNLAPNDKANDGKFKIWKIKDVTSTPELYIEYDEGLALGRKISIKGSIDKDAIITAPIYAPDQQFLRWQVKDGALVSTTPDIITIDGIEGKSWNTHADIVYTDPSDINSDYFAAYYTQPYKLAWVDGVTNKIKGWGPDNTSNWIVNGVDYTVFNEKPYVVQNSLNSFTWGTNDSALLFDASSPGSIATSVWELPTGIYGGKESGNGEKNGNGTGDVALKVSDDGLKLHLYFLFTNGQVGCVQFDANVE